MSPPTWVNTDPPLGEAQVGWGSWGMPLISQEAFGDTELHYPSDNRALPLSAVGQSEQLYDSGTRTFGSRTEGVFPLLRKMPNNLPEVEKQMKFVMERETAYRKTSQFIRVDIGPRMAVADVEWCAADDVENEEPKKYRIMAHAQGSVLFVARLAAKDEHRDPADADKRKDFNSRLPSLNTLRKHDFKREINQVMFDQPVGSGIPATRLLVRTENATYTVSLGEFIDLKDGQPLQEPVMELTSYFDVRDDKYVDCDIHGDLYAGVTADGTWRIHRAEMPESDEEEEEGPRNHPILAQGYDVRFEELSDWKAVLLFSVEGETKMVLASRKAVRLYSFDPEDMSAEPTFVNLFAQQHYGDIVMDMKRDVKYPNLLVVLTAARLIVYDMTKEKNYHQITRTMNLSPEDRSIKLSMSTVDGNSIAIVHSQLSLQKLFYTYAYLNPADPLLLAWVCDPYPILLLTQTPINSTELVQFTDSNVMLFDCDIDSCIVRKLLTTEPQKYSDYKPEPVDQFPGDFVRSKPPNMKTISLAGYSEMLLPSRQKAPVPVHEIAAKIDRLVKAWFNKGCRGQRTNLAELGLYETPSSIDEFGDMLKELENHYSSSAIRVVLHIDPVEKYDQLISVYVTPTQETPDRGNKRLAKYIMDHRIRTEKMCRRLAAQYAYMGCGLRPANEDKEQEKEKKKKKEEPLHVTRLVKDWVVGGPAVIDYNHWEEFGVRRKKRRAPTQQELLSEIAASRNAIPQLSLSSQVPSQRASLAPSSSNRASMAHRSSLARVASQDTRRQSAGPSGSQGRSKRRKTIGGFR